MSIYVSIYNRLEPNIEDAKTSAIDQDIMLSIAISLKRIADVISETPAEKEHRFKKYMESLGFKS